MVIVIKCLRQIAILILLACACQMVLAAGPYTYNAAGDEVTDAATGLVWRRCSAGQTWASATATCSNIASTMTHEAALSYAVSQPGWRLPNVKELSSLVNADRGAPSIDIAVFPNTSTSRYWTSTPYVGWTESAWYVDFNDGGADYILRVGAYYVRLVR